MSYGVSIGWNDGYGGFEEYVPPRQSLLADYRRYWQKYAETGEKLAYECAEETKWTLKDHYHEPEESFEILQREAWGKAIENGAKNG